MGKKISRPSAVAAAAIDREPTLLVWYPAVPSMFASDVGLVKKILEGDVRKWQAFVSRYSPFILRAVGSFTADHDERMDIYTHVLERLQANHFAKFRAFAFRSKLSTWLTVVARNMALDFLRAKYGRDFSKKKVYTCSLDQESNLQDCVADPRNPETTLRDDEALQEKESITAALRQAVGKLNNREALLLKLIYEDGCTIKEAGQVLGVPAVYRFLQRILANLQMDLQPAGPFFGGGRLNGKGKGREK